jgi:Raf kinase inhibitor-like YbhB/YbcL family protein
MRLLVRSPGPGRGIVSLCGAALTLALGGGLTACGGLTQDTDKAASLGDWFTVTSGAFREGGQIPTRYGCRDYRGEGKTPPLRWSGTPQAPATQAFAVVVDDPDAPSGSYVHWVIANIDGTTNELVEGARPDGAVEAANTSGKAAYKPPCPPKGQVHRYRFTVYALDERLPLQEGAELNDALTQIARQTIARGRLTGTFGTKS